MIHPIANAPCSWGVDDPKNPNLPAWATVLKEAAQAGYRSIELGPWGYLPTDPASLRAALEQHQLSLVAGTILIGYIHRSAALRDNTFTLLAGAFDIDAERGRQFGQRLGVDPDRCYADYQSLFRSEAARPDGIQAVSVATPNNTHYAICRAALEAGLHVVCEKPLCFSSEEADELVALSQQRRKIIGVTYGYAGHQLILQARQMIADGLLGDIRIVNMQFAHGFHAQPVEQENASTRWRVDPRFVGPSYVLGDLATHPLFLVETMAPQLKITRLMCARQSFVKSRAPLEDNAHVLMEYDNGAIGSLWSSAVNCGSMHGQKVRIIGEKASLEWWDEQPNQLRYEIQGEPVRILERGMDYLDPLARQDDRIGGGHPEGLFEAWSNLYRRFAIAMDAADRRDEALLADFWYPDARAGAFGVRWVENCVRSADNGACWVDFR
ncbi:TPA: Gfo/Idh/MocA family protein [Klebsiella pneumoniae]